MESHFNVMKRLRLPFVALYHHGHTEHLIGMIDRNAAQITLRDLPHVSQSVSVIIPGHIICFCRFQTAVRVEGQISVEAVLHLNQHEVAFVFLFEAYISHISVHLPAGFNRVIQKIVQYNTKIIYRDKRLTLQKKL